MQIYLLLISGAMAVKNQKGKRIRKVKKPVISQPPIVETVHRQLIQSRPVERENIQLDLSLENESHSDDDSKGEYDGTTTGHDYGYPAPYDSNESYDYPSFVQTTKYSTIPHGSGEINKHPRPAEDLDSNNIPMHIQPVQTKVYNPALHRTSPISTSTAMSQFNSANENMSENDVSMNADLGSSRQNHKIDLTAEKRISTTKTTTTTTATTTTEPIYYSEDYSDSEYPSYDKECDFTCDGGCIPEVFMCDGRPDCIDGTDENNCENNLCGECGDYLSLKRENHGTWTKVDTGNITCGHCVWIIVAPVSHTISMKVRSPENIKLTLYDGAAKEHLIFEINEIISTFRSFDSTQRYFTLEITFFHEAPSRIDIMVHPEMVQPEMATRSRINKIQSILSKLQTQIGDNYGEFRRAQARSNSLASTNYNKVENNAKELAEKNKVLNRTVQEATQTCMDNYSKLENHFQQQNIHFQKASIQINNTLNEINIMKRHQGEEENKLIALDSNVKELKSFKEYFPDAIQSLELKMEKQDRKTGSLTETFYDMEKSRDSKIDELEKKIEILEKRIPVQFAFQKSRVFLCQEYKCAELESHNISHYGEVNYSIGDNSGTRGVFSVPKRGIYEFEVAVDLKIDGKSRRELTELHFALKDVVGHQRMTDIAMYTRSNATNLILKAGRTTELSAKQRLYLSPNVTTSFTLRQILRLKLELSARLVAQTTD